MAWKKKKKKKKAGLLVRDSVPNRAGARGSLLEWAPTMLKWQSMCETVRERKTRESVHIFCCLGVWGVVLCSVVLLLFG